jgi:predicted nuclease with TOPRIM domain
LNSADNVDLQDLSTSKSEKLSQLQDTIKQVQLEQKAIEEEMQRRGDTTCNYYSV